MTREPPTVGIVTPSHNMARFLPETVESVLSQDYPHIDYLVMDGGSRDGTPELLASYEGLRWVSRPDGGQAEAVNRGFLDTTGAIFAFLNADDTYLPGAVTRVVERFLADPDAGVVYGEADHVAEDGSLIAPYPTLPFDRELLSRECFICQPAAFISRDAFAGVGMLNPELQFALDYDLWIRAARDFRIVKIDDLLATSRMHRESKTLSSRRQVHREVLGVLKDHYGYAPHNWLEAYACHLIDGKDQFFDRSRRGAGSHLLSLLLGSYHNRTQLRRYWREWSASTGLAGLAGRFTGR